MIKLKIIECPNKYIIGSVLFYSNLIEIGSTTGDLLLLSKDFSNHLFYLEVINDEVQVIPNPNIDYYLINGKRSLSQRKLQKGDLISLKNFSFSIEDFKYTEIEDYDSKISENFSKLEESSPLYELLIELDKEMMEQEDASN